jgi:tRNA(fMet)-specific endonuclease VapC
VRYLFDTDALSQIIKKNPSLTFIRRLASIEPEEQCTTTLTVGELVYGAHKSGRPGYFIEKLEKLVWPHIHILPFDEGAANVYGRLRAELEKKGMPLNEPDLRIASIALDRGLVVITGNLKHFSRVPDLRVEDWLGR